MVHRCQVRSINRHPKRTHSTAGEVSYLSAPGAIDSLASSNPAKALCVPSRLKSQWLAPMAASRAESPQGAGPDASRGFTTALFQKAPAHLHALRTEMQPRLGPSVAYLQPLDGEHLPSEGRRRTGVTCPASARRTTDRRGTPRPESTPQGDAPS